MTTKGERKALLFLAGVAFLGAATRVYRARHDAGPPADLDRQIGAVDSSRTHTSSPGTAKRGARKPTRVAKPPRAPKATEPPSSPVPVPPSFPQAVTRLDMDVATVATIEKLPGIGPALAKRIVAEREARGAFGCLVALDAVRGVGPSMLGRLDSLVTFSGAPRGVCSQH